MLIALWSIPATGSRFVQRSLFETHQAIAHQVPMENYDGRGTVLRSAETDAHVPIPHVRAPNIRKVVPDGMHTYTAFHLGIDTTWLGMTDLPEIDPWILPMRDPLLSCITRAGVNDDAAIVIRAYQHLLRRVVQPTPLYVDLSDVSPLTALVGSGGPIFDEKVAAWDRVGQSGETAVRQNLLAMADARDQQIRDALPELTWFDGRHELDALFAPYDLWWRHG